MFKTNLGLKNAQRPCTAKPTWAVKKDLYSIFFDDKCQIFQVQMTKGRTETGTFNKNDVLRKQKNYYTSHHSKTGFRHLQILYENAPAHKARLVAKAWSLRRLKSSHIPKYSLDLVPCSFYIFHKLKLYLFGKKYNSRTALESSVHLYMKGILIGDHKKSFRRWNSHLKLGIQVDGEHFEG